MDRMPHQGNGKGQCLSCQAAERRRRGLSRSDNTNFTFLAGVEDYDPQVGFGLISRALRKFDIECIVSGRNDLVVEREGEVRKFSGSAFRKLE